MADYETYEYPDYVFSEEEVKALRQLDAKNYPDTDELRRIMGWWSRIIRPSWSGTRTEIMRVFGLRYLVRPGARGWSESGATVFDTEKRLNDDRGYAPVCECFEIEDARRIAKVLNTDDRIDKRCVMLGLPRNDHA